MGNRVGRQFSRRSLAEICEPRYEELFTLVRDEIRRSGFEDTIAAGVVITGGAALMPGVIELGEQVFESPVRLGLPERVSGLVDVVKNPKYATGIGLLLYGYQQQHEGGHETVRYEGNSVGLFSRMKNWVTCSF